MTPLEIESYCHNNANITVTPDNLLKIAQVINSKAYLDFLGNPWYCGRRIETRKNRVEFKIPYSPSFGICLSHPLSVRVTPTLFKQIRAASTYEDWDRIYTITFPELIKLLPTRAEKIEKILVDA